jgi:hypothetical protein
MKTTRQHRRGGFTLLELTMATVVGMTVSAMVLALSNQQLAFLKIYRTQDFLSQEAPVISMYVSKIIGKAERFRLHDSVSDALAARNPRLTPSPVLLLNFRQPDGTMRASILSFENRGSGPALYYYVVPNSGVLGEPQWFLTNRPANVQFTMEQGILRMVLTGPQNERITYSGTMQQ